VWGKIIGGVTGFAMGGPFGAVVGAALGHAADSGGFSPVNFPLGSPRPAALPGGRDQFFAISVVVIAAKLAKCDGPVVRAEIDAFKRSFHIPPDHLRQVGRLFDQARDSDAGFETYARQLGAAFADSRGVLEDVLVALFVIARADGPLNRREESFLLAVGNAFGLDADAYERASGARTRWRSSGAGEEDPYAVLGIARGTSPEEIRAAWRRLVRENHPDSLASRGVPDDLIAHAQQKVARINAAWDRIKRDRGM
jgi:DnaJ like chaperone protein